MLLFINAPLRSLLPVSLSRLAHPWLSPLLLVCLAVAACHGAQPLVQAMATILLLCHSLFSLSFYLVFLVINSYMPHLYSQEVGLSDLVRVLGELSKLVLSNCLNLSNCGPQQNNEETSSQTTRHLI